MPMCARETQPTSRFGHCTRLLLLAVASAAMSAGCANAGSAAPTPGGGDDSGMLGGGGDGPVGGGGGDGANPLDAGGGDLASPPLSCPAATGAPPNAHPLYPDPVFADLHGLGQTIKTVCIDTAAPAAHGMLDTLLPSLVADAGLTLASGGAACDLSIVFTNSAAGLCSGATAAWSAAGSNPERYFVVSDGAAGRSTLFAAAESAGLYAVRAALALVQADPASTSTRRLVTGTIVDHPTFAWRGVVEGEYGPSVQPYDCASSSVFYSPYRPQDRVAMIRLMSRLRMNAFIYGPKCDVYARFNWQTPYPPSEGQVIATAAHEADVNFVKFIWSISPGNNYGFNATDFNTLTAKIDSVRALGVHHFALFMDDIGGTLDAPTGTAHGNLMNQLEDYLKKKDPTDHLIVVGTNYAINPTSYSNALGQVLHPDVEVMWTGTAVEPSTMSAGDMTGINSSLKRKVTIWDNWPNSPGSFTGRAADLPNAVQGYYSNPVLCEFPSPANPPMTYLQSLGAIGDYTWSPSDYLADANGSFKRWQPILTSLMGKVQPCAPCGGAGQPVVGWTCSGADRVDYCDNATKCMIGLSCPGGCKIMPNGVPDQCN